MADKPRQIIEEPQSPENQRVPPIVREQNARTVLPMTNATSAVNTGTLVVIGAFAAAMAMLYFAQEVLIPLALATFVSFLLTPLVRMIQHRLHLGRTLAVVIVTAVSLLAVSGLIYVVGNQMVELAQELPQYKENIKKKLVALRPNKNSVFSKWKQTAAELQTAIEDPGTTGTGTQPTTTSVRRTVVATETGGGATTTTETIADSGASAEKKSGDGSTAASPAAPGAIEVRVVNSDELASRDAPEQRGQRGSVGAGSGGGGGPGAQGGSGSGNFSMGSLSGMLGPLSGFLAQTGIVIIFVVFMLLQMDDLRDRIVRLLGYSSISITTTAMDETSQRVTKYLQMLALVNITYGIPVWLGLWLIAGLPNAPLWGLLATLLRFIPYLGPWIAASMPIALAIAISPGWMTPIIVISIFLVLELISNNVIEPLLYGNSTGLSPVAILVSAVFWTWLWGPVGLFLATPLTVCLVVLGRYVPQLKFLDVLLGDAPVLKPGDRIYQRLVANKVDEAMEMALEESKERPLEQVFDDLLMPSLCRVEEDISAGRLDAARERYVKRSIYDIMDELTTQPARVKRVKAEQEAVISARDTAQAAAAPGASPEEAPVEGPSPDLTAAPFRVVIVPSRDEGDEMAGAMAELVATEIPGVQIKNIHWSSLPLEIAEAAYREPADLYIVSSVPPHSIAHAGYMGRRLRARLHREDIAFGLWGCPMEGEKARERLLNLRPDQLITSYAELRTYLETKYARFQKSAAEGQTAPAAAATA